MKPGRWLLPAGALGILALVVILCSPVSAYWSTVSTKSLLSALDPAAYRPQGGDLALVCISGPEADGGKQARLRSALTVYEAARQRAALTATSHRLAGQAYCLLGDYPRAAESFEQALGANPADVISSSELLGLYTRAGDWDAFHKFLSENSVSAYDMAQAAEILANTGQISSAVVWCRAALEIDPNEREVWLAWLQTGWALEKQKDWAGAEAIFAAALSEQERLQVQAYAGSFYFHLGLSRGNVNQQENTPVVFEQYDRAIEKGDFANIWDQASAYIHRGNGYRSSEPAQLGRALKDYEAALRVNPKSATAAQLIGEVYLQDLHELDQAEKYIRLAISLSPKTPYFDVLLGDTLAEKGDLRGAVAAYQRALADKPEWTSIQKRLQTIQAKIDGKGAP